MNILFQSTPFRIKREQTQGFERWFRLFQKEKQVELERLDPEMGDCYQFVSKANHSFFTKMTDSKTIEMWMEELATYLPEDEECWVLETAHHEVTHWMTHQAVKITSRTITNHSLEEFIYRQEEDTIENRYRRLLQTKPTFCK